jgi:hypothetical protein
LVTPTTNESSSYESSREHRDFVVEADKLGLDISS